MEINLWHCLHCEDDSRLLLRQRAPEVCVFHGSRLECWYHSNSTGLYTRRNRNVTIPAVLDCFLTAARGSPNGATRELGGQTPAAIFRRRASTTLADTGRGLVDAQHATVLSVQELTQVLQRAQNGVEDEEASVWSLQTIVHPLEDIRVISVYSCDASGVERSDIFGRSYSKLYPWTFEKDVALPNLDELTADRCLPIGGQRRADIEAKTLGIVRFASRFHSLEFEGLVLEFIFDAHDHPVLHGCWNASLFSPDNRRKIRSGCLPGRIPAAPRMFPVPSVVEAVAAEASAEARDRKSVV